MNVESAELGATVELTGTLESAERGTPSVLLRCEQLRSLSSNRPWSPNPRWQKARCVLRLDDKSTITLELSTLEPSGLLPYERRKATWPALKEELLLFREGASAPPSDEVLIESIVASISHGDRVRVRGTVTEHRHTSGDSGEAFRSSGPRQIASLSVTHVVTGDDAETTLRNALAGVTEKLPSVFDQTATGLSFCLMLAAMVTAPTVLISSVTGRVYLWSFALYLAGLGGCLADGGLTALRLRTLRNRLASPEQSSSTSDFRVLFFMIAISVGPMLLVLALMDAYRMGAAGAVDSHVQLAFGATVIGSCLYMVEAIKMLVFTWSRTAPFLAARSTQNNADHVLSATIVDPTPVDGPLGKAAVAMITDEEVVPGSDPNQYNARAENIDGFFLKLDDPAEGSSLNVHIALEQIEWSTSVRSSSMSGKSASGNTITHHAEIIPLGGKVLAVGKVIPLNSTTATVRYSLGPTPMLICAPHENPTQLLRRVRSTTIKGFAIVALTLGLTALIGYSQWSLLPHMPPGDSSSD